MIAPAGPASRALRVLSMTLAGHPGLRTLMPEAVEKIARSREGGWVWTAYGVVVPGRRRDAGSHVVIACSSLVAYVTKADQLSVLGSCRQVSTSPSCGSWLPSMETKQCRRRRSGADAGGGTGSSACAVMFGRIHRGVPARRGAIPPAILSVYRTHVRYASSCVLVRTVAHHQSELCRATPRREGGCCVHRVGSWGT